ncbi:ankyrin repeat domain-containing protein 45 isoform X2 [Megalobrama amblycephala]|uniref:ankyrin repeat domain-containing protein 45 isoform X2 n=1 Tax=Megalobrama amblycephala TaxID=75352 RepID=UPI0020146A00|nr:ankyrin repeat domain-containing protein 45 isoform X2 [Megalobrama amblycephala]
MRSAEEKTVLLCALDDDVEGLKRLLESKRDSDTQESENILWEKDEVGRNALFTACMLGRSGIVRELVQNGADVNEFTARGYSPLHCSAMWGQLDTLKTLVELNADFQAINFRGEKAVDVARHYDKLDCAEYLAWAEAKESLQALIQEVRDIIADQEKVQGKLSKEDKNVCINICSAKSDWIHKTKTATIQDFIEQKKHLEDVLATILLKLNTQSEATTKTRKH